MHTSMRRWASSYVRINLIRRAPRVFDSLAHHNEGVSMVLDPGSWASLPAKIGADFQQQHQVTTVFCAELLCPPDDTIRISRGPGTRPDFFDLGCEQAEFPGALDHKLLGYLGVTAQMLQVENQDISRPDLLATLGVRFRPDGFCGQPKTKHGAQQPAQVDCSRHVEIIARKRNIGASTEACHQALNSVGLVDERTNCNA